LIRTLLNTFPTWLLALALVGGTAGAAAAGLTVVRRRFPELGQHGVNDVIGVVIGVLAAVFGILLGFVTVALYEDFTDAKATVQAEATDLIQLYEDTRAFPADPAARIEGEIRSYIAAVRFSEWEHMREGGSDTSIGDRHIGDLYEALRAYEPDTASRTAFYEDAVGRINELVDARRTRLDYAAESLPVAFRIMLGFGALMLISSLYLLGSENRRLHMMLVVAVAVITSFNLLIVIALDHPFSGDISVSNAPFDQERLKSLNVTRADLDGR